MDIKDLSKAGESNGNAAASSDRRSPIITKGAVANKHKYDKLEEQKQQEKRKTLFGVRKSGPAKESAQALNHSMSAHSIGFLTDSSEAGQNQ